MLDAKKAFDSVKHCFITAVLEAHGLTDFAKVFNTLYKDQKVDILLNGDVCEGYSIRNGVKQGDSLSCILFIMCINLVIKSIERNPRIEGVEAEHHLPKVLAYADDLTCIVKDKKSVKRILQAYETFSKISGLVLNPEKTEIISLGTDTPMGEINVKYMGERHTLRVNKGGILNGVYISSDEVF